MNLFRSAALVSALTFVSRIAGLIRENLIASIFGAGAFTDAFFVAFRLPNMLRRMFAEGAFSQAFVPLLAAARRDGQRPNDLIDRVATGLFWVVAAVAALGVVGAPALLWLVASGLARDPAAFDAGVLMTRIMFPYIVLISLVSLCGGILNTGNASRYRRSRRFCSISRSSRRRSCWRRSWSRRSSRWPSA
ncbi:MAG: lipid II flippase MurJ [Burkholderiaceae bacterium]